MPGGTPFGPKVALSRGAGDGDAETVRADQTRAVGADEREQPLLALGAFAAGLGEARGDHAQRLHARAQRGLGCLDDRFTGKADDSEVDAAGISSIEA